MKTLSEPGENDSFELCWQEAYKFVTLADVLEKKAICARIEPHLSVLSDKDRASFIKHLEARDGRMNELATSQRDKKVRFLRDTIDAKP